MTDDLDPLLEKLPRRTAPASLRARLERKHGRPSANGGGRAFGRGWRAQNVVIALVALSFVGVVLFFGRRVDRNAPESPLVTEAVNDHLRVLYSDHPLEIESGGIHQVKPWFAGRVDFAPIVPFDGDAEFPLQGGLVAYYIDRKAACFVYKHNLHVITLFVLPSHDLPWPRAGRMTSESRGFHAILWRADDLGYALVSDVSMSELTLLEHKLHGTPPASAHAPDDPLY